MNIANILLKASQKYPDRSAISIGSEVLYTFRSLYLRVSYLAASMQQKLLLKPGDRVAIVMPNHPEYLVIRYAAWFAGLTVVPINSKLHGLEISYMLNHSGSIVCFTLTQLTETLTSDSYARQTTVSVIDVESEEYRDMTKARQAIEIEERGSGDIAWLFYTSGTTGKPKGVMITHHNLLIGAMTFLTDVNDVEASDSIFHAAPLSHGSGFYDLPYVMRGANQVIPNSGRFVPSEVCELLESWQGVSMFLAPTMVKRLAELYQSEKFTTNGLKTIIYGGGPMYVQDIKWAIETLGPHFVQIYGQGESPMTITVLTKAVINDATNPRHQERLGSVGTAQNVVTMKIQREDGTDVPNGEMGEVLVKGPVVAAGYWNDKEATQATWREGWLHTGDIGFIDADGFLTLVDRAKDMIISGGSNIYPREVEEVLLAHPLVSEAAVVGQFSGDWGESVVAFVVMVPNAEPDEHTLDQFCIDHIARFKRPKKYYFLESLPKNNYGKVLKTNLRKMLA